MPRSGSLVVNLVANLVANIVANIVENPASIANPSTMILGSVVYLGQTLKKRKSYMKY